MAPMLETYLQLIRAFNALQLALMDKLAPVLQFKAATVAGHHITPTETSIPAQIKAWPTSIYLLPLGSWVEPRQGVLELADGTWQFTLHGTQEISFIHQGTGQDVSLAFSAQGDIGMTEWDMRTFLQTTNTPHKEKLIETNARFFATLVEQGLLTPIPPKPLFEEAVFVLQMNRIKGNQSLGSDC